MDTSTAEVVAIRVDAGPQIGIGHLMRTLTLADGLRRQGALVRFISRDLPANLQQLLHERGHEFAALPPGPAGTAGDLAHSHWLAVDSVRDAGDTLAALGDRSWHWLIVDHYALDVRWEQSLRAKARRILVIDDLADRKHDCDILVDQNLYADAAHRYAGKVSAACRWLVGPRFALLRAEFEGLHEAALPREGSVRRLLVSFGGADRDNHTASALAALEGIHGIEVDVVLGAGHPCLEELRAHCVRAGYTYHVQTARMGELMNEADLALGAGGATTWERCCVGLPAIVLIAAENQRQLVRDAAAAGLVHWPEISGDLAAGLRRHLLALMESPLQRAALSRAGLQLVDGGGVARVLAAMSIAGIEVRRATPDDANQLLEWRNHPLVRQSSRSSAVITPKAHAAWLSRVFADANRPLLIGQCAGRGVGVVRFDITGDQAEVSIHLSADFLGRGAGAGLLPAAEAWLRHERPDVRRLRAVVLAGNGASHRLFTTSGYSTCLTEYAKELA